MKARFASLRDVMIGVNSAGLREQELMVVCGDVGEIK
jgi:hypothetical protein